MAIVIAQFDDIFRVKLDEYVCKLAWDDKHSLWALTGKQNLYKLDSSRECRDLIVKTCGDFSLNDDLVAYVVDEGKIVVRSIASLDTISELQCDTRIHRICLHQNGVVIASNDGLKLWNFKSQECTVINPLPIVAMDMCLFGEEGTRLMTAAWKLCCKSLSTGELRVLQTREYDVEYPFYGLANFDDRYLCVSSSRLEIFDNELNLIASSPDVRAVEAVFIDANTLVVREGGCQEESALRSECALACELRNHSGFRIIIAADAASLAFDMETRFLAIAGGGYLTVQKPRE